jgi:predicted nucleic acid-binding protein
LAKEYLFVDTAYVYALINPRDQWHLEAVEWRKRIKSEKRLLLTTEFILAEIADGLSAITFRPAAARAIHILQENPFVKIVPASSELFAQALTLYEQRSDKNWGLTDCVSFVVMEENKITDALTTDDHFRQAGFTALLLS